VVSDVHLGDETSEYIAFSEFLDWVGVLEKEGKKTIKASGKKILIKPPEKLILLGDILELWSPYKEDMKYTVQRSIEPFGKLAGLECEKIFVLGNHDESLADYLDVVTKLKRKKCIKENVFKINNSDFKIINHHYPENPEDRKKGFLQIGNYKYFFIHGQQFDRFFVTLGPLSNIPAHTSEISGTFSRIFPFKGWSLVVAFIVSGILNWKIFRFKNAYLSAFTGISFLLSIPRLFTCLQDPLWKIFSKVLVDKPKYKDIKTIVEQNYYDVNKDKTGWDVNIVFGHTHIPQIDSYKFKENGKEYKCLFLNSGSWTTEKGAYNTFIYLDETGYYLFKWNPGGDIEQIPPGSYYNCQSRRLD
jgi:UDP-2,3-diacylglucosamine pyrophosphatase LpxH